MTTISAVIITKNEGKRIGECLSSLKGVVDEIIVVDSFSEDHTPEICREFNVNFHQREWEGYSKTKNLANQLASSDYILSIDGDEILSEKLREQLIHIKPLLEGVYAFNRLNHYLGKPITCCGWYPDTKIRLFPRLETYWQGEVHEELVFSSPQKETLLEGDLLHFPYDSVEDHERQTLNYAKLGAEKLVSGKKGGLFIKGVFSPVWRFLKMYLLQGGIREGQAGWNISRMAMREVRLKYKWARERQHREE